jgi:uncharacterized protein
MISKKLDKSLKDFIMRKVVPMYNKHDSGHNIDHLKEVVDFSLKLAKVVKDKIDLNILFASAAFHDVGLQVNREDHHIHSGKIVRKLKTLKKWFDEKEIEIIANACEDHRASGKNPIRSIYGKIVSDADRSSLFDIERLLERMWLYREDMVKKGISDEEIFEDIYLFAYKKMSKEKGYAKIQLPETLKLMGKEIKRTHEHISDKEKLWKLFSEMRKDGRLK